MKVKFTVQGSPPKKSQQHSVFSQKQKYNQSEKVLKLREKAISARKKVGMDQPFSSDVSVELTMFITPKDASRFYSMGDLDNFVSGVLDSLQKANKNAKDPVQSNKISSYEPIFFDDDKKVVSIKAKKIKISSEQENFYEIIVEGIKETTK